MADIVCHRHQMLYRKRTKVHTQYYTVPSETTESCRRDRHRSEICNHKHLLSRHISVAAKYFVLLVIASLFDQFLQPPQLLVVVAFTATSKYYKTTTFHPAARHGREVFATTAGNAEMEYRQRSNPNHDSTFNGNTDESDIDANGWKEVPGGFVPQLGNQSNTQHRTESTKLTDTISSNPPSSTQSPSAFSNTSSSPSPMKKNTTPTTMRIRQLSNIKDYKHYVVDDVDPNKVTITVVRFYAPWCRACQAIQQRYYRLAQQYEQRMQLLPPSPQNEETLSSSSRSSSSSYSDVVVRFMECPVTKDNAILHQGLGVPSLPYGHIYHSKAGLVEEMKLNKNVFTNFESTLASYVNGYCTISYGDEEDEVKRATADNNTMISQSNDYFDPATTPSTFE